jgi:hypothetical protein
VRGLALIATLRRLPRAEVPVVLDMRDGLRGLEIANPDGHVLFFGRPRKRLSGLLPQKIPSFLSDGAGRTCVKYQCRVQGAL